MAIGMILGLDRFPYQVLSTWSFHLLGEFLGPTSEWKNFIGAKASGGTLELVIMLHKEASRLNWEPASVHHLSYQSNQAFMFSISSTVESLWKW